MPPRKRFEQELLDSPDDGAGRVLSLWYDACTVLRADGYWHSLIEEHAAHEVWASLPRALRVPKTQKELAEWLVLDQDTLIRWRKKHPDRYQAGADKIKRLLQTMVVDVLGAVYVRALGENGAQDSKTLLAAAGVTTNQTDLLSGGAPLKTYTVLANPDQWDEPDEDAHGRVDPPALAG